MPRVVIDTNVLVSFLLTAGRAVSALLDEWEGRQIEVVTSPLIHDEFIRVVGRPRLRTHIAPEAVEALVRRLERDASWVPGHLELAGVTNDPNDDIFVAAAMEGQADYIVSRDPHLLDLGEYQGIKIISPRGFVELLG